MQHEKLASGQVDIPKIQGNQGFFHLSEPEYRALKNLAHSAGKSVEEEIEHAVDLWKKTCKSSNELALWSQTDRKFRCLHGAVRLTSFSGLAPNLIEAAIRRHIHNFDIDTEIENCGCHFENARILTLQVSKSVIDRLMELKRAEGMSLGALISRAIQEFILVSGNLGNSPDLGQLPNVRPRRNAKKCLRDSTEEIHVSLNREDLETLVIGMGLTLKNVEGAVGHVIDWKFGRNKTFIS